MVGNSNFEKRKNLCGLGVSAVKKGYRRGAETLRGFVGRWEMGMFVNVNPPA